MLIRTVHGSESEHESNATGILDSSREYLYSAESRKQTSPGKESFLKCDLAKRKMSNAEISCHSQAVRVQGLGQPKIDDGESRDPQLPFAVAVLQYN